MSRAIDLDMETGLGGAPTEQGRWSRLSRVGTGHFNELLIVGILLLLVTVFFAPQIFQTIKSGEVGVLYRRFQGGTQTDRVLGEGMKVIPPWDTLFIYNVRVQEAKHSMDVLTSEGLTVNLQLSIRYHPELELVGLLHQQVGPDYATKIVIPEVESALRTNLGGRPMRDVYGSERGLVQKIINDSLEHVSQKFVQIDEIILRGVVLPKNVTAVIEQKMSQKELAESYEYRIDIANKEAERLKIEAEGIRQYHSILDSSLTASVLRWQGIEATKELAKSPNAKTIVIGDKSGLPLILGER